VRTFAKDGIAAQVDAWFDQLVRSIETGKPLTDQIAASLTKLSGAALDSWFAESCFGSYPLSVIASSRVASSDTPLNGQFLVLTVELSLDGMPWIAAAPLVVGASRL
jgi:hypothetical protein